MQFCTASTERPMSENSAPRHECVERSNVESEPFPQSFLSAAPFIPSYLREPEKSSSPGPTVQLDACNEENTEDVIEVNNEPSETPTLDFTQMTLGQYNMFMELLPADIQDLLQVNLSHIRACLDSTNSDAVDTSMRIRAASATFDQLSLEQLNFVHEVWGTIFGEDNGGVNADPNAFFAYTDWDLTAEEEEWFMSQALEGGDTAVDKKKKKKKKKK